ncbi:MAG: type II secretion system protein [Lachnospiraceae bacterium]|nr:type II secretion system protein [Lachnospiraceae bacterium]
MIDSKLKKKSKNGGFSLVEVLLAICILGLVAAPVLQMFYSSYAVNAKSKRYLAAADLLQTTLEKVSSLSYENVTTPKASGSVVIQGAKEYYGYDGTNPVKKNVTYSGYKFIVELNFEEKTGSGKYKTVKVTCKIIDNDDESKTKGTVLCDATTRILNKPIVTN